MARRRIASVRGGARPRKADLAHARKAAVRRLRKRLRKVRFVRAARRIGGDLAQFRSSWQLAGSLVRSFSHHSSLLRLGEQLDESVSAGVLHPVHAAVALQAAGKGHGWSVGSNSRPWRLLAPWVAAPLVHQATSIVRRHRNVFLYSSQMHKARMVVESTGKSETVVIAKSFRDAAIVILAKDDEIEKHTFRGGKVIPAPLIGGITSIRVAVSLNPKAVARRHREAHLELRQCFPTALIETTVLPKGTSKGYPPLGDPIVTSLAEDMIQRIDAAMMATGSRYFAAFGTLLGVVRDARPIEWDDDVDLIVQAPFDAEAFLAHLHRDGLVIETRTRRLSVRRQRRFESASESTTRKLNLKCWHTNAPWPRLSVSILVAHKERAIDKYVARVVGRDFVFREETFSKAGMSQFCSTPIPVPHNATDILEEYYGKDWRTPVKTWGPYAEVMRSEPHGEIEQLNTRSSFD